MNHRRGLAIGLPAIGEKGIVVGSRIDPDQRAEPQWNEAPPRFWGRQIEQRRLNRMWYVFRPRPNWCPVSVHETGL